MAPRSRSVPNQTLEMPESLPIVSERHRRMMSETRHLKLRGIPRYVSFQNSTINMPINYYNITSDGYSSGRLKTRIKDKNTKNKKTEPKRGILANLEKLLPLGIKFDDMAFGDQNSYSDLNTQKKSFFIQKKLPAKQHQLPTLTSMTDDIDTFYDGVVDNVNNAIDELKSIRHALHNNTPQAQVRYTDIFTSHNCTSDASMGMLTSTFEMMQHLTDSITDLRKMTVKPKDIRKSCKSINVQVDDVIPKPISMANMNFNNLLKELSRCILLKSDRVQPTLIDQTTDIDKVLLSSVGDQQAIKIMVHMISSYQEHILLEEVIAILREQEYDLDGIFKIVYHKLGVLNVVKDASDSGDINEDTPYSEASLEYPNDKETTHMQNHVFKLDFDELQRSEDEVDEGNEDEENNEEE